MKGGLPGKIDDYSIVNVNEFEIYIPKTMSFNEEVVKIVDFKRKNGMVGVGVSNVNENN